MPQTSHFSKAELINTSDFFKCIPLDMHISYNSSLQSSGKLCPPWNEEHEKNIPQWKYGKKIPPFPNPHQNHPYIHFNEGN